MPAESQKNDVGQSGSADNTASAESPEKGGSPKTQPTGTKRGRLHNWLEVWGKSLGAWGQLIIGILGLLFGYVIGTQQQRLSKELTNQQLQLTKETEEKKKAVSESQLNLEKNQFAASLINSLIKGSKAERLLALAALKDVDLYKWEVYSEILAQYDPDETVRRHTIEQLGKNGEGTTRHTLVMIQEQGKTPADRQTAKTAEANLTSKLREHLKNARAFFDIKQWKSAADSFYEAAKYVDASQVDSARLALARSHYDHGGYEDAAIEFNHLFAKL